MGCRLPVAPRVSFRSRAVRARTSGHVSLAARRRRSVGRRRRRCSTAGPRFARRSAEARSRNEGWIWPDLINSAATLFGGRRRAQLLSRHARRAARLTRRWEWRTSSIEPFIGGRWESAPTRSPRLRRPTGAHGASRVATTATTCCGRIPRIDDGTITSVLFGGASRLGRRRRTCGARLAWAGRWGDLSASVDRRFVSSTFAANDLRRRDQLSDLRRAIAAVRGARADHAERTRAAAALGLRRRRREPADHRDALARRRPAPLSRRPLQHPHRAAGRSRCSARRSSRCAKSSPAPTSADAGARAGDRASRLAMSVVYVGVSRRPGAAAMGFSPGGSRSTADAPSVCAASTARATFENVIFAAVRALTQPQERPV